jgi:hypothetical protein
MRRTQVIAASGVVFVLSFACPSLGQVALQCANISAVSKDNHTYDANGVRCVVGNGGCDFQIEAASGEFGRYNFAKNSYDYSKESIHKAIVSSAEGGLPQACYRVNLAVRPLWVSSATWADDLKEIILIDPLEAKFLAYDNSGNIGRIPESLARIGLQLRPASISSDGNSGFLLEGEEGELERLDKNLQPLNNGAVLRYKSADGKRVGSLFQWKVAGDFLLAYGSILDRDSQSSANGFFQVSLSDSMSAPLSMVKSLEDSSFYLLGNSYIATDKGAGYFVAMDQRPVIYRIAPAKGSVPQRLDIVPNEYKSGPKFKTLMRGAHSAAQHFAELETFSVISGLYAEKGMLYLLARKPNANGMTVWELFKIDPKKPMIVGHAILPTSADFLTVIPSPDAWYLLERGPVGDMQRQEIKTMLVVSSSVMELPSSMPRDCPSR